MDGSHAATTPVPNEHVVTVEWWRTTADVIVPLGKSWEGEVLVPYDWKSVRARYRLPDGTYFNNPEGDLHHKTEVLQSLGDVELTAHYHWGNFRFTAGTSVPTGKTYSNPYETTDSLIAHHQALGLSLKPHHHIQFGTGTFDPILRAAWSTPVLPDLRFSTAISTRTPLYENPRGYKGSTVVDLSAGPVVQVVEGLSLAAAYSVNYQTRAFWDGVPDENSGFFTQAASFSAFIHLAKGVTLRPNFLYYLDVNTRGDFDTFTLDWIAGATLDVQF